MDALILVLAAATGLALYRHVPPFRRHLDELAGERLLPDREEGKKETTNEETNGHANEGNKA